jgi:hypothetical protein
MKILKSLSRKEFRSQFGTSDFCLSFLSDQKWQVGFICLKCKNNQCSKGKQLYNRRCTHCGYDESPTANTLFHKVKFGITDAFEMCYDIVTSKKGANSIWLAERHGVKQMTAWLFRRKVQEVMKSSEKNQLVNTVHVDEFEIRGNKSGRAYAKVIEDFSCKSLAPIFETHINPNAYIVTDKWSGYKPLKSIFPRLTSQLSDNGNNFKVLHF